MVQENVTAGRETYIGLFMVTLTTLVYEILLTRIFSVTMWYHYAFVAVSLALFGMTVGAILVYLWPSYFTQERTKNHLSLSAWCFGISTLLSFLTFASIPFTMSGSLIGVYSLILTYAVLSIPFVFSGICVSLALTRFPQDVSKLYATDLAGAASGCILVIYILKVTDGPGAVIVVALLACIGAFCFALGEQSRGLRQGALISSILLALFVSAHTVLAIEQRPFFRLLWVKGEIEDRPLFEKWNSFSRIRIDGDPSTADRPFGWGLSYLLPSNLKIEQLDLNIDGSALTKLTAFHGDVGALDYLKYDIINLAYYTRHAANVLVIGPGGGRDILSSLVFGEKSVVAVELNGDIIAAVNGRFGDFTGHLDKNPRITFVNDEARSYIARQNMRFDIIQASLVDTWAATAAGAFVLSENSLYTVDAWKLFLDRLSPDGLLTFSRWYVRSRPAEMYRLTSLAAAALKGVGVKNPRTHIVVAAMLGKFPVGTMLVSKRPFTADELGTIERVAGTMGFNLILTPTQSLDSTFARLASGEDAGKAAAGLPLNIAPPTDDSPFFFHMLRLQDIFNRSVWEQEESDRNAQAILVLGILLFTVIVLTLACIIAPLALITEKGVLRGAAPLLVFFASIGFGFILVEISQMQRLIVFLGHPTYGLSVVLFALLLSSGLGSQLTQTVSDRGIMTAGGWRFCLLLCALALFGKLTPHVVSIFQAATTPLRILVAIALLSPLGVFMGMAFPLGMKLASKDFKAITPWLWGINGATSVCGSVVAVVIALSAGISASFWTGVACYVAAVVAFLLAGQESVSKVQQGRLARFYRPTKLA